MQRKGSYSVPQANRNVFDFFTQAARGFSQSQQSLQLTNRKSWNRPFFIWFCRLLCHFCVSKIEMSASWRDFKDSLINVIRKYRVLYDSNCSVCTRNDFTKLSWSPLYISVNKFICPNYIRFRTMSQIQNRCFRLLCCRMCCLKYSSNNIFIFALLTPWLKIIRERVAHGIILCN